MNSRIQIVMSLVLLAGAQSLRGADTARPPGPKPEKREMRMPVPRDGERRVLRHRAGEENVEQETVAFLGVETGPVSPAVSTQLGLARDTGLVVNHIVPDSPAAEALRQHDILLKLDDQILIETRQLSVLIRNKKEGDEVTLTYLRGGKQATAKVKLGKHEVPKFSAMLPTLHGPLGFPPEHFELFAPRLEGDRENVDRVLSMIQRAPNGNPVRINAGREGGPGFRAMRVNTGNSTLAYNDDEGSLDLTMKDGMKTLVAKDAQGDEVFSGPVTTPEERRALPPRVRERLEKLEGMRDVTFRTDGDFHGPEPRIARPRGIAFPLPGPAPVIAPPAPRRAPATF